MAVIGNSEQAKELATQAINLNQNLAMAYAVRGRILNSEQEFESAYKDLQKAFSLEPENGIINAFYGGYAPDDLISKNNTSTHQNFRSF